MPIRAVERLNKAKADKAKRYMDRREIIAFLEKFLLRLAFEPRAYYMAYIFTVAILILIGVKMDEGIQCGLIAGFACAALSFGN